jgi:sulfur carrier protein ThiS
MVNFRLPAYLQALVPEADRRSMWLEPGSWSALVRQVGERFPQLAGRIMPDSLRLATGFVLVVNDEIVRGDHASLQLRSGDEVVIIAAVAGG